MHGTLPAGTLGAGHDPERTSDLTTFDPAPTAGTGKLPPRSNSDLLNPTLAVPEKTTPTLPIETYGDLVRVLRDRVAELGIIFDTVDSVAGLPTRYFSKCASEGALKHLGIRSVFLVLAALGLRLRVERDDQALEKLRARSDWQLLVRSGPRYRPRGRPRGRPRKNQGI